MENIDNKKLEDILYTEHEKEIKRKKAEIFNFGWGESDFGIASKTSKGILDSQIDPDTLKITHVWD
jgi:hypothetical protein